MAMFYQKEIKNITYLTKILDVDFSVGISYNAYINCKDIDKSEIIINEIYIYYGLGMGIELSDNISSNPVNKTFFLFLKNYILSSDIKKKLIEWANQQTL